MAKQSEMSRVLANLDQQIADLQTARKLITDAQATRPTSKPRVRAKSPRKATPTASSTDSQETD